MTAKVIPRITNALKSGEWDGFKKSLKYALYVSTHPFDGFWDLTHEKRGSLAAAHFIVAATVIVEILRLMLTSFQFVLVHMEYYNVVITILQILVPLFLWTVANWSLTTLMDGKGRLRDIYMATAYALTPYVLINAVMIPLSHILTFQEGAIYWFLASLAVFWFVGLLISGMMMTHDYTMSKTIFSCLLTMVAIGVMVFIFIMFFSVISDGIAYFISLFRELSFRFM